MERVFVLMRLWHTFRIGLLLVMFAGLTVYLVATTPWGRWFGRPATYAGILREGDVLVGAIERYRARCGLWPEYLEDLVPGELAKAPSPRWYYTLTAGGPSLAMATSERRTHVGYVFDAEQPGWRVFGEVENRVLRVDPPMRGVERTPGLLAAQGAELERRIGREPTLVEHRQAYVSFLVLSGQQGKAEGAARGAEEAFPEHFWPRMALGMWSADGAADFAKWVGTHGSFTHQYYLARLLALRGEDSAAIEAAAGTLGFAVEASEDDDRVLGYYLWDLTRGALARRDYGLVLRFTAAWGKARAAQRVEDGSDLPLEAAARLAQGDFAEARVAMGRFDKEKPAAWARHVEALRGAIAREERGFVYEPGGLPAPYEVFVMPQ